MMKPAPIRVRRRGLDRCLSKQAPYEINTISDGAMLHVNEGIARCMSSLFLPRRRYKLAPRGLGGTATGDGLTGRELSHNLRDDREDAEGLTNLALLFLDKARVTDADLVHLKGLTNLQRFSLGGTGAAPRLRESQVLGLVGFVLRESTLRATGLALPNPPEKAS